MSFFDTFCEMLVIFFAIAMGYLANRLKIMGGEMDQKVSKLLLYITVPALSLGSVLARETLPPLREFVSILLIVVGLLAIPFPYLFIHFGLELGGTWWTILGIGLGVILGCVILFLSYVFQYGRTLQIASDETL